MHPTLYRAASLFLALLPAVGARAQDVVLPAAGTTGTGTPFDQRAAGGQHLGAVDFYAGGYVEGLRLQFRDRYGANTVLSPLVGAANVQVATFTPAGVEYVERVDVWVASGFVNRVALQLNTGAVHSFGPTRAGEVQTVFTAGADREIVGLHGTAGPTIYSLGVVTRPVLATAQVFGSPCQTSLGPVTMRFRVGAEFLRLGANTIAEVTNVPASSGAAFLTLGFSRTQAGSIPLPLPLTSFGAPGCTVWASNECTQLCGRDPNDTAGFNFYVPVSNVLIGVTVHFQGYVPGPWNAAQIAASNGLTGLCGVL